jgi:CelD/BcsL family acetyltransferase involved in cellulose biosynthesis
VALITETVSSPEAMGPFEADWDALAVASDRPYSTPAWIKSWWENLRPGRSRLCVVFVTDAGRLVGVGPFCAVGDGYFPAGRGAAAAEPLAAPGMQEGVGAAIAAALAAEERAPARLELSFHRSSGDWATAIGRSWKGRPAWHRLQAENAVPYVDLGDGFDVWMQAKSSSFRREARRKRKRLDQAGAEFRYSEEASLERDVTELMRLHRQRQAGQGGTALTDSGVERMLVGLGRRLLESDRFRLLCLEVDGTFIAGQLLLSTGSEFSAWNSGFDEDYSALSPSMQCLIRALEDASERGEQGMNLGPGGQDYKLRLADSTDTLEAHLIVPPGPRHALVRLRIGAEKMNKDLRAMVRRRLVS